MISRQWKGISPKDRAEDYIRHLLDDTFPTCQQIEGFISAEICHRELDEAVEFLIITKWKDFESIRAFAGEKAEIAVIPDFVDDLMISYDKEVKHYQID